MNPNEERLHFLIQQVESRISLIDTKASIFLAGFGILLAGTSAILAFRPDNEWLRVVYMLIIDAGVALMVFSAILLILTIRPIEIKGDNWQKQKWWKKYFGNEKNTPRSDEDYTYWLDTEKRLDDFAFIDDDDKNEAALLELFKKLSKTRIIKYNNYRLSMKWLRISLIPLTFAFVLGFFTKYGEMIIDALK